MEDKGFLGALFDLSFSEFVTTKLVKILYILLLILVAIGLVIGLITSVISLFSRGGFLAGLMGLIFTPIGALIWVIMARVWMEIIIVVFRIAENTSDLVQMKRQQ
jgi:glycerol-3-phosphate acyltransferase PlsY